MIRVFGADSDDFTSNGFCVLTPKRCDVTETLNGAYDLELEHPLDEQGRWKALSPEAILVVPVPSAMTPSVRYNTNRKEVWKTTVATGAYSFSRVSFVNGSTGYNYSWHADADGNILQDFSPEDEIAYYKTKKTASIKKNTSLIYMGEQSYPLSYLNKKSKVAWLQDHVYCECVTNKGVHVLIPREAVTFSKAVVELEDAIEDVVEPTRLRDQPFRIERVTQTLDGVVAYARHIFYDAAVKALPAQSFRGSCTVVASSFFECCYDGTAITENQFQVHSDIIQDIGITVSDTNPVDALLGDNMLLERTGGELLRDWFDVYVVSRVGSDTEHVIRERKNLQGVTYDVSYEDVITTLMPVGDNKGKPVYCNNYREMRKIGDTNSFQAIDHHGKFIESPLAERYTLKRVQPYVVDEDVYKHVKASQIPNALGENAVFRFQNEELDLPKVTVNVIFVNLKDTEEYADYAPLQNMYLGDSVRVITEKLGLNVKLRMTEYTYDCIAEKYSVMTLGSTTNTLAKSVLNRSQLPTGIITSSKLALNAVSSRSIADAAVCSLQLAEAAVQTTHVEDDAITTPKIVDGAITTAKIENAAIGTAQIADAAITTATIENAAIGTAQIADAAITAAKIENAAIGSAQIADAAITAAKIENAAIGTAQVADAAITAAKIGKAAVGSAQIADAAITAAKIEKAAVGSAHIEDAAITSAKIENASITTAKMALLSVTEAQMAAASITAAKIVDGTITNAKIANGTIDTAKIALGCITTALIADGAIGNAQIADASITEAKIVSLSANAIQTGTLSVERLVIVGTDKSIVYTINEENGTPQLSKTSIDGGALTQRSITSDRIVAQSITADELSAGCVTTEKILAGSVTAACIAAQSITTNLLSSEVGDNLNISANAAIEFVYNRAKSYAEDITDEARTYVEKAQGYQRFTPEGLELGAEESPFMVRLTHERLSFLESGEEVAFMKNNKLYITTAQVAEKLTVGTTANGFFDFETTPNGLALCWRE